EDLHWAGSESLALLEQLQPFIHDLRLLVIATYRDDETPDLPVHFPLAKNLKLARLNEEQIGELSAAMLGEAGNQPHVIDLLKRETEGNVFFIIEVIRTLAEEAGHLEQIGLMTLPQQVFAGGMWRIIQRRLEHVPDYARPLLCLAAVGGRQLNLALLRSLDSEIDLERWLVACSNAAVLEVVDSNWRFTHDKLREGVLDDVSLADRRKLHARVAVALEALYGRPPEYVPALAYHWGVAENDEQEALYTRLAGEQFVRSGAYREAIVYLERAIDLMKDAPPLERIAVQDRLAEAHLGVGGYEHARKLYQENLLLARRNKLLIAEASTLSHLGDVAHARNQSDDARGFYNQSLEIYRHLNDSAGIARALNNLGNVAYDTGDQQAARQLYQESLTLTREIGGLWSMAGAIRADGGNHHTLDTQEVQELLNTLDTHLNSGNKIAAVSVLYQLGETAQEKGNTADAREYFRKSAGLAREVDDLAGLAQSYSALGRLELDYNRTDARKHLSRALQAAYSARATRLVLEVLFGIARYYESTQSERAVELLAVILYHPEIPDELQDSAENMVFELEALVSAGTMETVWERGKNRIFDSLIQEILKEL
ncbi:MAG TPA: tetratricopeptide repeat protein, partial [Phototrophicaceae bacterium]|nr:tetratricopeptide repeat protein [Phototrophicaceae bacterium]